MSTPVPLRSDFDTIGLRMLARRSRDPDQTRRLLALAEIYDGGSRPDAARIAEASIQFHVAAALLKVKESWNDNQQESNLRYIFLSMLVFFAAYAPADSRESRPRIGHHSGQNGPSPKGWGGGGGYHH